MPDSSTYSALPIPLEGEAADNPSVFAAFRASLEPRIVLFASSEADRNAKYGSVPAGSLVSCTTTPTLWQKSAAGWNVLAHDSGWQSIPTMNSSDFSNIATRWRLRNGWIEFQLNVTYNGATITSPSNGGIVDVKILDLPVAARPEGPNHVRGLYAGRYGSGALLAAYTGAVWISDYTPNQTIESGDTITATCSWVAAS